MAKTNSNKQFSAKFPGTCGECEQPFPDGATIVARNYSGFVPRNRYAHADTDTCVAATAEAIALAAYKANHAAALPDPEPDYYEAHDAYAAGMDDALATALETAKQRPTNGTYTVVFPDDTRTTVRIAEPGKNSRYYGETILKLFTGTDNESDYTGIGFVNGGTVKVWRRLADTDIAARALAAFDVLASGDNDVLAEAGLAYALEANRCYRCNRLLTVPASIHRGLGPECAKRSGSVAKELSLYGMRSGTTAAFELQRAQEAYVARERTKNDDAAAIVLDHMLANFGSARAWAATNNPEWYYSDGEDPEGQPEAACARAFQRYVVEGHVKLNGEWS